MDSLNADAIQEKQKAAEGEKTIYPWVVVGILLLLNIFSWLDRQIIVMMIDPIRHDLQITDVQVSLLTGFAYAIFYAICGFPLAWAADRFSRRWVIFLGVIFWSFATMACGFARSFGQLFLGRIAVGSGEAALSPASFSLVADTLPPSRLGLGTAIISSASAIGIGLSFTIGGYIATVVSHGEMVTVPIIGEMRAWQLAFLLVGLPGPLFALLAFAIKEPKRKAKTSATLPVPSAHFLQYFVQHWKFYILHMFGMSSMSLAFYGVISWGPIYLTRVMGWSPVQTGSVFGLFLAPSILGGMVGGGAIVDHFYRRGMKDAHLRLYTYAALIATPIMLTGIILSIVYHSAWIFLIGLLCSHIIVQGSSGAGIAAMQIVTPPEYRARMVSVFLFITIIAGLGSAPLFVASLTQYVFQDDKAVGWSLAILYACVWPLGAFLFWQGAKQLRIIQQQRGL